MSKPSIHTMVATFCGSVFLAACPGDDTTATGTETGGEPTSSGPVDTTTPPPTSTPPDDTTDDTTTVALDDTSSSGPGPTTSTSDDTTGTTGASTTGTTGDDTTGTTGGSSSSQGGSSESSTGDPPPMEGYGDCANNDEAVVCQLDEICLGDGMGNAVCSEQVCVDAADCALPTTGDAVPTCMDVIGGGSVTDCYLDCSMGEACPDGMVCQLDFVCLWPPFVPGGGVCPDQDLGSTVPQTAMGDNTGLFDDWIPSCTDGGEDAMFLFTAPAASTYVFDTLGSPFDTVLVVLDDCDGPELGCNDDAGGATSEVVIDLAAGQSVIVVVEGFGGGTGAFTLNINAM